MAAPVVSNLPRTTPGQPVDGGDLPAGPSYRATAWRSIPLLLWPWAFYLLLTAGSGSVLGQWPWSEFAVAAIVGVLCAWGGGRVIGRPFSPAWLDPVRWCAGLLYMVGPFFYALCKANLEVLYRIVTGRIQPAIVRIEPGIDSEMGLCLLANSITLSPGTLTLVVDEADKALYIHCLHWKPTADREAATRAVAGTFLPWVRWLSR